VLDVICFKWAPPQGYRSQFGPAQVNTLKCMVARHYPDPHRFSCVTDDAAGIDDDVRIVPLWNDFADIPSPHGGKNPSCYRRLKLFSADAATLIGERFVCMDLDTVITGDLRPIFNRPEDFVMYGDNTNPRTHYNGSLLMMTAGARRQVWDDFDPQRSPHLAMGHGHFGSDQGWISYKLGGAEATWKRKDGIFSYRCHIAMRADRDRLPSGARMVMFHGRWDPWNPVIHQIPWVKEHYR
jgi:hypothetical protein